MRIRVSRGEIALRKLICVPAALLALACASEIVTRPSVPNAAVPVAARAVSSDVTVSGTTPDSAIQDTTLDVVISGSGFVAGSVASWALAGVQDPAQVRTNSTRYVSSRQLVANITISRTATPAKWDVMVAAGTKGGIGTEAFAVTPRNATSLWKLPLNSAGLGLRSDGLFTAGTNSVYEDGICSVKGTIFTTGSGDATLQTNNPNSKTKGCQSRTMTVVYPPGDPAYPTGGTETMLVFLNVRSISNSATTISVGYANRVERAFTLNPTQNQRCDAWRWTNVTFPGDMVWVERTDASTYHVYTKDRDPDPTLAAVNAQNNRAVCTTTGQVHHLSVDFYMVSKDLIP
ncbi:MAG: hypothetical protein ABJC63_02875 [Gemmatimonadales bacterium]